MSAARAAIDRTNRVSMTQHTAAVRVRERAIRPEDTMGRLSGFALIAALVASLACGGGGSDDVAPTGIGSIASSAPAIAPEWTAAGVSPDGGNVLTTSDTVFAVQYADGNSKDRANKVAAALEAGGWKRTFETDDAESATIMLEKDGGKIAIATSKDGSGVLLSAAVVGTPPSSWGKAPTTTSSSGGSAPAAEAPAPAAEKPKAKKKDCDGPWYTCDKGCEDRGWSCKTSCPSITDECADACGEVMWDCEQECNKVKWACEG